MSESFADISIILSDSNPDSIANLHSFFQKMPIRYQIIAVNPDERYLQDTPQIIFASSYLGATKLFTGKLVFWMRSDFEVPLAEVVSFMACFYEKPEIKVIYGDRFTKPKRMSAPELKIEKALRLVIQFFARLFLGLESQDLLCPFNAYRSEEAKLIFSKMRISQSEEIEQKLRAKSLGLKFQNLAVLRTARRGSTLENSHKIGRFIRQISELLSLKIREH